MLPDTSVLTRQKASVSGAFPDTFVSNSKRQKCQAILPDTSFCTWLIFHC